MTSPVEERTGAPVPGALAAIDIGTNSVHMLIARVAGNGRFEVITRHVNELPRSPRELVPELPVEAEAWILRALAQPGAGRGAATALLL